MSIKEKGRTIGPTLKKGGIKSSASTTEGEDRKRRNFALDNYNHLRSLDGRGLPEAILAPLRVRALTALLDARRQ